MPKSSNSKKYEAIRHELEADDSLVIAELCRKHGVKYNNFNQWMRNNRDTSTIPIPTKVPKTPRTRGLGPETITIHIPLHEVVDAYQEGKETINIPRARVFQVMSLEDQTRFDATYGRLQREREDRVLETRRTVKSVPEQGITLPVDGDGH